MSNTGKAFAWVRFAFTAPWSLLGWLWLVLLCLCWVADIRKIRFTGAGVLTSVWRPWFAAKYNYSLTVGRAIIWHPASVSDAGIPDPRVQKHENVHLAQVEDNMFLSFVVGLAVAGWTGDVLLGLLLWISGGAWQLGNYVTALLRYGYLVSWPSSGSTFSRLKSYLYGLFVGVAYQDSEHERSAYAQTDVDESGTSWSDRRDSRR